MHYSTAPTDGTHRHRLIVATVAALLVLVAAAATYSLLAQRQDASQPAFEAGSIPDLDKAEPLEPLVPDRSTALSLALPGSDPETFVRRVAQALFEWDTDTITTPSELTERLVAVADPTGESSPGLVADVANYLPTPDAWAELRRYETRQWIEITSTDIPSLWPTALRQAGPDGFLPGTTAYTVQGVRHRTGIWEGAPVSTAHDVAFTVFVVCGPSYPECHLLRLSRPHEPLG